MRKVFVTWMALLVLLPGLALAAQSMQPQLPTTFSGKTQGKSSGKLPEGANAPPMEAATPPQPVKLHTTTGFETPVDPAGYHLVVGDVFTLTLARPGAATLEKTLRVLPQGKVMLPYLGAMDAYGQTLSAFTQKVQARYKEAFPDFTATLLLDEPGSFTVTVLGGVENPGQYEVNAITRLDALLSMAGEVEDWGTLRSVALTRGGTTATYDLTRYQHRGELRQNPTLVPETVVNVPVKFGTITVEGEVNAPEDYEIVEGETVADAIALARGLTSTADPTSVLVRRLSRGGTGAAAMEKLTVNLDGGGDTPLMDGDRITVYPYNQTKGGQAKLFGAVREPGDFDVFEGMTLKDLLYQAGGLRPGIGGTKGLVLTRGKDGAPTKVSVDLSRYPQVEPLALHPGDQVFVFDPDQLRGFVTVEGAVMQPGALPFTKGMTALEALNMAGGLRLAVSDSAELPGQGGDKPASTLGVVDLRQAFVLRRQLSDNGEITHDEALPLRLDRLVDGGGEDVALQPGDRIVIAEEHDQILVTGFVDRPGAFDFIPNRTAIFYARQAGMPREADKGSVEVVKLTGQVAHGPDQVVYPGELVRVEERASSRRTRKFTFYSNFITSVLVFANYFQNN